MESKAVFFVAQMMPPMCFVVCVFFCRIDTHTHYQSGESEKSSGWNPCNFVALTVFLEPGTLLKMNFKITSNRGSTLGDSMFHTFAIINLIYQEFLQQDPRVTTPKTWVSSSPISN